MAVKNGKRLTKFVLPKFKKGDKVKTKEGLGDISSIRNESGYGYWYLINDRWYAEHEIIQ